MRPEIGRNSCTSLVPFFDGGRNSIFKIQPSNIPQSSVWRILQHHLKLQLSQEISDGDKVNRLELANFTKSFTLDQLGNILWSNEATFKLDGVIKRQNYLCGVR